MKKFFIEEAKCDITNGGFACGPVSGNIAVTVKFNDGKDEKWLSLVEVEGIPNFFLANKDVHDDIVKEDIDDNEFTEYLNSHAIDEFEGITLGEYVDILESISDDPENPAIPLVRYLIALVRCDRSNEEGLVEMAKGKYADELDIPISDVEEEYIADFEEED